MANAQKMKKKPGAARVTQKQANLALTLMNKGKKSMPMDAEDKLDHGADEATENADGSKKRSIADALSYKGGK